MKLKTKQDLVEKQLVVNRAMALVVPHLRKVVILGEGACNTHSLALLAVRTGNDNFLPDNYEPHLSMFPKSLSVKPGIVVLLRVGPLLPLRILRVSWCPLDRLPAEHSKRNKTVPEKVATTCTEDGHKQTTKTSTTI